MKRRREVRGKKNGFLDKSKIEVFWAIFLKYEQSISYLKKIALVDV